MDKDDDGFIDKFKFVLSLLVEYKEMEMLQSRTILFGLLLGLLSD